MEALTPSLEDYLEAIWTISLRDKVARVKDIAKSLRVSTPSVVNALNVLLEKNLIKHERYGYIELTDQGALKAKEVDEHHKLLFTLLNEIFGINAGIASKDACKIEHHLSKETIKRIEQFIQFLEEDQEEKAFFTSRFKDFVEKGEEDMGDKKVSKADFTLRDLKPGEKGKVIKIKGKGNLKKRLLDMGIVPGTEIQLKKVAPLGDPVDILVKGYHLSLRKGEARDILLEKV
ncbi:MAG: DtxR family transcriptional regulator [Deltaproteobacteria bacterium]|nr:DtxR family transcriptional regulator [Deltaproteobacteria bacterium]